MKQDQQETLATKAKHRIPAPDDAWHEQERAEKQRLDDLRDLGFGTRASQKQGKRLLNHDGSFNVGRSGVPFGAAFNMYQTLLTMTWTRFYLAMTFGYLLINALFATFYLLVGENGLAGIRESTLLGRWTEEFFFSVHTFSTVGYGNVTPVSGLANWLVTVEIFIGLLSSALATGILFARFSRPTTKIMYSERAVIGPYRDITGWMFRIANLRQSQLIEVQVQVMMVTIRQNGERRTRHYEGLVLERSKVAFFPLHWTVVHPIDESSPLFGLSAQDLDDLEAEFIILITATDDTFSQTVHSRNSYLWTEVVSNANFIDAYHMTDDGILRVDVEKFHAVRSVG